MTDQESAAQKEVDKIYQYAFDLIATLEKTPEEAIQSLIDKGLRRTEAEIVVNNVIQQVSNARKEKAKRNMLFGALWCVGGIIVTALTYQAASGGGRYVIAWGAILFGAVQFIRGAIVMMEK